MLVRAHKYCADRETYIVERIVSNLYTYIPLQRPSVVYITSSYRSLDECVQSSGKMGAFYSLSVRIISITVVNNGYNS